MQIGNNTKIIVVDDRGKDAIRIARSLRQFGRAKAYVLEVSLLRLCGLKRSVLAWHSPNNLRQFANHWLVHSQHIDG